MQRWPTAAVHLLIRVVCIRGSASPRDRDSRMYLYVRACTHVPAQCHKNILSHYPGLPVAFEELADVVVFVLVGVATPQVCPLPFCTNRQHHMR